jgi:hypothetical protein
MRSLICSSLILIAVAGNAPAYFADFDICPQWVDGKIGVSGVTHAAFVNPMTGINLGPNPTYLYYLGGLRVFSYPLAAGSGGAISTGDPGINNLVGTDRDAAIDQDTVYLNGTGMPLGSVLQFTILSDLQYWTGSGLTAVPNGETLKITYGSSRMAGTGTGPLAPLSVKTFNVDSTVHLHMTSRLYDSSSGNNPTPGIYLIQARLDSPGNQSSDPFWIVYNYNDLPDHNDAAVNWVQNILIAGPVATVHGLMVLNSFGGDVASVPITVELRNGSTNRRTVLLDGSGYLNIYYVTPGTYDIWIKPSH